MLPLAKTTSLLVRDLGSEVLILNEEAKQCYCLNHLASKVWRKCDGLHTLEEIMNQLETELKITENNHKFQYSVNLEFNRLKDAQLLEEAGLAQKFMQSKVECLAGE